MANQYIWHEAAFAAGRVGGGWERGGIGRVYRSNTPGCVIMECFIKSGAIDGDVVNVSCRIRTLLKTYVTSSDVTSRSRDGNDAKPKSKRHRRGLNAFQIQTRVFYFKNNLYRNIGFAKVTFLKST